MVRPSRTPPDAGRPRAGSTWGVLVKRNFWPYFAGNLLSNCGTWFQNIAQAILVYRLTGSTFLVGVVNFAQFAGVFVLAPVAGSAADRFDRRRLLVTTQVAAATVTALLAVLAWAGLASTWVVVLLALGLGFANAFAIPALQALVPLLVTREELASAVALSSLTFTLARAVGPVLGALVVARLGVADAFALNSLSFLALVGALALVRPRGQAARPAKPPRLNESIRMVRDDARLAAMLLTVAAIALTADPVSTLTPGFATRVFHRSDTMTGPLVSAFGAGAAVAALTVVGRFEVSWRNLGATCAMLGVGIAAFGLSGSLTLAFPALFLAGMGFLSANTAATTEVQLGVDDSQRGRVMALWSVAFLGMRPFGSLVDGGVAAAAGLRVAAVAMAAPALLAAVVLPVRFRGRPVA